MSAPPRLSIVVACIEAERTIAGCLASLAEATRGLPVEVIVAHASAVGFAERVLALWPGARIVSSPPGALVPRLWGDGLKAARGGVVAFTLGQCRLAPGWARALLEPVEAGASGAGGPLALDPDSGVVDWAVYLLRYSAFAPPVAGGRVAEVAGDNAAYDRGALERHGSTVAAEFWEVDLHRRVRAEGGHLRMVPEAIAAFGRSFSFGTIFRHRFTHGRHAGAFRASTGAASAARIVLAAPLVPVVLAGRCLMRAAGRRELRWRAVIAVPVLLALGAAWAAGEAVGAWALLGLRRAA